MDREQGAFTRATGRVVEDAGDKPRYRRYQYDLIAPHCGRSVLEVGAGLGEFAAQFAGLLRPADPGRPPGLERLVVSDVDPDAVALLKDRFADAEVCQFDLAAGACLERPVESAVAINVLEHFEDDAGVLALLARSVVPGGTVVIWVPGYQSLYSDFDRSVGHVRRYTPATLRDAAGRAGLDCELVRPVNVLGGLAWWAAMRVGRTRSPKSGAVGMYDRLVVPATRVLDRLAVPFGQSVLAVIRVPGEQR